ncbi:MAG TPA: hypothetical protein VGE01_11615 [Fimbriimonas sp.]
MPRPLPLVALALCLVSCKGEKTVSQAPPSIPGPAAEADPQAPAPPTEVAATPEKQPGTNEPSETSVAPDRPAAKPAPPQPAQKGQKKPANGLPPLPQQMFEPSRPGTEGWTKSAQSAMAIAKKVDEKMASLKGVSWQWRTFAELPEGRAQSYGTGMVAGPKKFRYEFSVIGASKQDPVSKSTWVADGTNASLLSRQGVSNPAPVERVDRGKTQNIANEWPKKLHELMFAAIGSNKRPISTYIAAVAKPGSGYRVLTEDRSILNEGTAYNNSRILVTRLADKAKKANKLELEMVFNSNYNLPVSARVSETMPNGRTYLFTWGGNWNLDQGQKFDPAKFEIPAGPF